MNRARDGELQRLCLSHPIRWQTPSHSEVRILPTNPAVHVDDILEGTLGVLREKFKRSRELLIVAEEFIRVSAYFAAPTEPPDVVPDGEDQNRILECAMAVDCDYVVTGDGDLLRMGSFRRIRILSVSEFLAVSAEGKA